MSSAAQIKRIVLDAKKNRKNRAYYDCSFGLDSLTESGVIQCSEKAQFDRVALSESQNESIQIFGFDQSGSYFNLSVFILSLYPNVQQPDKESRWRLASANFDYLNSKDNCRYSYSTKQLIDYDEKRANSVQHEAKNVYRIGMLSIETVLPFSLARILFNGMLTKVSGENRGKSELVSARISISTHPTCDKFDYKYKFCCKFMTKKLEETFQNNSKNSMLNRGANQLSVEGLKIEAKKLLNLILEDRIDQPLMFQGQLELLAAEIKPIERYNLLMWGGRVKRFINPKETLSTEDNKSYDDSERESLLIWTECGHSINLNRLVRYPNCVYGLLSSMLDYPSYFYAASLFKTNVANGEVSEITFDQLKSFSKLNSDYRILLTGFKGLKKYSIQVIGSQILNWPQQDWTGIAKYLKVKVNGFNGFALLRNDNFERKIRLAQSKLWALNIEDELMTFQLASEKLLGGKGNSLVNLNRFLKPSLTTTTTTVSPLLSQQAVDGCYTNNKYNEQHIVKVSVPRGLVLSCVAYQIWLNKSPEIEDSIRALDNKRKTLAASSVYLNPMSDKYLTPAQKQQILKDQCQKTRAKLISSTLPLDLKSHFYSELVEIFGEQSLVVPTTGHNNGSSQDKRIQFAVRSSAVGEDSLESSAAGQMKTILGVRGFDTICKSIVECWASQFELEAVTYKSQNGLALNLPMAVVVQELIQCEVAGVAATCSPLTGNKEYLEILANPGLGEGVVSGKETDTIRVSLKQLAWDPAHEAPIGQLRMPTKDIGAEVISIVSSDSSNSKQNAENSLKEKDCCLSKERIVSLANLLIQLRRLSEIKDREVEWGITSLLDSTATTASSTSSSKSPSSSSSSSLNQSGESNRGFYIHLLQSRPLTHLARSNSREISHELDFGFASPLEIVSRANIGEVMPGALCPINCTYFNTITSRSTPHKPFESNHTHQMFVSDSFGFFKQLGVIVWTHTDSVTRFSLIDSEELQRKTDALKALIGIGTFAEEAEQSKLYDEEKRNPVSKIKLESLGSMLARDSGLTELKHLTAKRRAKRTKLEDDLTNLGEFIDKLEKSAEHDDQKSTAINKATVASLALNKANGSGNLIVQQIRTEVLKLFDRLCTLTEPLKSAWINHMEATLLSIGFNTICMIFLSKQPAYPDKLDSDEILNDFSVLVQGDQRTESWDVSDSLDELVKSIVKEGQLEKAKELNQKELYNYLTASNTQTRRLYERFIKKNGHRTYKEFDFASHTWQDDPSSMVKSLAFRLKQYEANLTVANQADNTKVSSIEIHNRERQIKVDEILNKITTNKTLITGYLLPRARNAVIRREKTKSGIIKIIDKYRRAFRHLGGLLCLDGRLPSADLVFQLTIEELDQVVHLAEEQCADLGRIIYKARRRQQCARIMNQVNFPKPTMKFSDMYVAIEGMSGDAESGTAAKVISPQTELATPPTIDSEVRANEDTDQIRGITSCGGCVTGRACVVNSLNDMDEIEPNDILITYSIDISWSVYFFCLAGIVTEVGGIISHGAVIAREYGIPTLCTAVGACSKFKTGQMITLNANEGVCYLAKRAEIAAANEELPVLSSS